MTRIITWCSVHHNLPNIDRLLDHLRDGKHKPGDYGRQDNGCGVEQWEVLLSEGNVLAASEETIRAEREKMFRHGAKPELR